jgi:hypothetical protein
MGRILGFLKHLGRALGFPFVEGWENTDWEWCPPGWAASVLEIELRRQEEAKKIAVDQKRKRHVQ